MACFTKQDLSTRAITQPFKKQAFVFTCLQYKSFENMVGKGEIAHNGQILLFPQCFLPIWRTFCYYLSNSKLSSAKSYSLEKSKFVVKESVKVMNIPPHQLLAKKLLLLQSMKFHLRAITQ